MEIDESYVRRSAQLGDSMLPPMACRARKTGLIQHVERAFDLRSFYEKVGVRENPVEVQTTP